MINKSEDHDALTSTLSNAILLKRSTSMTIYYLMIKTHNITGLKYLCQTKKKDPFKYLGSGKDWMIHLNKYGTSIRTEILIASPNKQEINDTGRYYSELWNIVHGQDDFGNKIWANKIPETGGGGGQACISADAVRRRAITQTGTKKPLSHKMKCSNRMLAEHANMDSIYNSVTLALKKSNSMKRCRGDKTSATKFNTPEYHAKIKESCKRGAAKCRLHYLIVSPKGTIYDVFGLSEFCREHNLNRGAMGAVTRGEIKHYKGWTGAKHQDQTKQIK